jgi:hypothetical protein
MLARFLDSFQESHWIAARKVLGYLKATKHLALIIGNIPYNVFPADATPPVPIPGIVAYSDSDYAGDPSRRSRSSYVLFVHGSIFAWSSKLMSCIALSTYEAEIIAMSDSSKAIVGASQVTVELGDPQQTALLIGDNNASLNTAHGVLKNARSKHIDVRYLYFQQLCDQSILNTKWIPSKDNRADLNSKPHANISYFRRLRDSLHVIDPARLNLSYQNL